MAMKLLEDTHGNISIIARIEAQMGGMFYLVGRLAKKSIFIFIHNNHLILDNIISRSTSQDTRIPYPTSAISKEAVSRKAPSPRPDKCREESQLSTRSALDLPVKSWAQKGIDVDTCGSSQ
ncbi:hypothetical protein PVK06_038125 [Gossypium arboreum]|uniref:Uncharacterized protein n=1 Tax=Gossypium arboreum TaxID=29729 RepID=A0ABR0MZC0_GOSAR|nr:hypothetical protein PVK06_038125 [Gossypium arboreum]